MERRPSRNGAPDAALVSPTAPGAGPGQHVLWSARRALLASAVLLLALASVAVALRSRAAAAPPSNPVRTLAPANGPSPSSVSRCEGVSLTLSAELQNGTTRFRGVLKNGGPRPVTLIQPGDGSEAGWRTPILTWQVKTLSGTPVAPSRGARCGNMNQLDASEVFPLRPGEQVALDRWLGRPFVPDGRYVVRLVYENDPNRLGRDGSMAAPLVQKAFRTSTPCRVQSQELLVDLKTYRPPTETQPEPLLELPPKLQPLAN